MFSFFKPAAYRTLNTIWINQTALMDNHRQLQNLYPKTLFCPVLKSNAYGHGLTTIGPAMDQFGCPYLMVDSLFEAYELLKIGTKTKILIMGYTDPQNFRVKRLPFEYAVYDIELAAELNRSQPGCKIHLFIDTGMNREGIPLSQLPDFLSRLVLLKNIEVIGIMSHLADSDAVSDNGSVPDQLKQFDRASELISQAGHVLKWRQLANSAGALQFPETATSSCNIVRAGLAHYGLSPLPAKQTPASLSLQPVLRFCSTIVQVKSVKIGEKIGYNGTFTAKKPMTIAVLPAGYYEGVDRRLSNIGVVKVGQQFCPIVGRVSMNMTVIDVTANPKVQVGDQVIIYSDQPEDLNSIAHAAETTGTIPYELLVHLAESVRRQISL